MIRERVRHDMTVRHVTVARRTELTPSIVRITLAGDDLSDFTALGPTDHVKVFFPDPATGIVTAPSIGAEGVRRPTDGTVISRDYTPRAFRAATGDGPAELDIDFVLHSAAPGQFVPDANTADTDAGTGAANGGPASAWAATASVGSPLAIAGPRGSRLAPAECDSAILIADETALPAFSRWLELLPENTRITAILDAADESVEDYVSAEQRSRASIEWLYREDGPGQLDEALRSIGTIGPDTYVWAAGEASTLVSLRRYLRYEAGLSPEQLSVEGYWKRGITNLDHHAPIDPTDPD
jgi:NADPH-dependent ferric siderophore reductase